VRAQGKFGFVYIFDVLCDTFNVLRAVIISSATSTNLAILLGRHGGFVIQALLKLTPYDGMKRRRQLKVR